jgi:hypothetical protein
MLSFSLCDQFGKEHLTVLQSSLFGYCYHWQIVIRFIWPKVITIIGAYYINKNIRTFINKKIAIVVFEVLNKCFLFSLGVNCFESFQSISSFFSFSFFFLSRWRFKKFLIGQQNILFRSDIEFSSLEFLKLRLNQHFTHYQ